MHMRTAAFRSASLLLALQLGACDGPVEAGKLDSGHPSTGDGDGDGDTDDGNDASSGDGDGDAGDDAQVPVVCDKSQSDADQDGFTVEQGDCRDCDPLSNPAAYDVPGNAIDEDCNGVADDEPKDCDNALPIEGDDARDAVKALGLCRTQKDKTWGLVSAKYVFPDGTSKSIGSDCRGQPPHPLSHGLLNSYADHLTPRQGSSLVALSTGIARTGLHDVPSPGYGTSPRGGYMCRLSSAPEGFPAQEPACPGVASGSDSEVWDGMALELKIKVPSNAYALRFSFDFFSGEFPEFVCSGRNDHFVALLTSQHPSTPSNGNISLDAVGNVVNVNSGFMRVCTPQTLKGRTHLCPKGPTELEGSEIDGLYGDNEGNLFMAGGATSWLQTKAWVMPGETITLRFAIWDANGGALDSTVLLDNFEWVLAEQPMLPVEEDPQTGPIIF